MVVVMVMVMVVVVVVVVAAVMAASVGPFGLRRSVSGTKRGLHYTAPRRTTARASPCPGPCASRLPSSQTASKSGAQGRPLAGAEACALRARRAQSDVGSVEIGY